MSTNDEFKDFEKYRYNPSLAAAILFAVLFALTTSTHLWQLLRSRAWFMIPFLIGGILEIIGYAGRTVSATESAPWSLVPYIVQTVALLIAPALLAASIYMLLGRIAGALRAEDKLLIRRSRLTWTFVTGDILSFLAQAAGGSMLGAAKSQNGVHTGQYLIIGGLFLQIVFFGLFVLVAGIFNIRFRDQQTREMRYLYSLYAVSLLIFVRSIVRVVEYLQGYKGYIISHEVFLYVFDGTLMFLAMVVLNAIHPGHLRRAPTRDVEKSIHDVDAESS